MRSSAACGAVLALALLASRPAQAVWGGPHEVFHATAHTLESGEGMFGVLTPLAYGINDRVTVIMHPVLWVLLTPNGGIRWKVFETDRVAVALKVEAAQAIVTGGDLSDIAGGGALGHAIGAGVISVDVGADVMLTATTGYQRDISPDDDGATFGGGVTWLVSPVHLLMLQGGARWSASEEAVTDVSATLLYAHSWDSLQAGVGLAYGDFPVLGTNSDAIRSPVWPVLDVWWRF